MPGCDRPPAACHTHHRDHWADGGTTCLTNGCLLCLAHHRQVHLQGWRVTLDRHELPQLIPPKWLDPEQRPRQHARFAARKLSPACPRDRAGP